MKKIFTIVVLAVAAFAMVSCNKAEKQVEESVNKAVQAKDVKRLIAIGDSIQGLGDKADAKMMVEGVKSYAAAFDVISKDSTKASATFPTVDDVNKFCDNFVALYDAANKKDADALKKSADDIKKVDGGVAPEELITQVKQSKEALKIMVGAAQAIVNEAAVEAASQPDATDGADGADADGSDDAQQ